MMAASSENLAYGYNSRSELVSATLGNDNYSYAFDAIGNRETSSEAGTALAYATNNLNQYTEIASSESSASFAFNPTYDADGNATLIRTSTGTWTISYNAENRPIRFENAGTQTVVECRYDSQGRRVEKKVTVAGTTMLHHRYIYRGYLQIAALDLTRAAHPALWLVTWDPTQPTATRPLALQKDGTWFTYGYDITKNVCELFGPNGYIRTAYSYTPFGSVSASENGVVQNFQWSSEYYDSELDLVYYNYRHYSPSLGRFLSRDPIAEQGFNLLFKESPQRPSFGDFYTLVKNCVPLYSDTKGLDITLETDNVGIRPFQTGLHQQICVDVWRSAQPGCTEKNKWECCHSIKECFSFGWYEDSRFSLPRFSITWLGWKTLVLGPILNGRISLAPVVENATITSRHITTMKQDANWRNYMKNSRNGLEDAYTLLDLNCRTYAQWEFRDAPLHW